MSLHWSQPPSPAPPPAFPPARAGGIQRLWSSLYSAAANADSFFASSLVTAKQAVSMLSLLVRQISFCAPAGIFFEP